MTLIVSSIVYAQHFYLTCCDRGCAGEVISEQILNWNVNRKESLPLIRKKDQTREISACFISTLDLISKNILIQKNIFFLLWRSLCDDKADSPWERITEKELIFLPRHKDKAISLEVEERKMTSLYSEILPLVPKPKLSLRSTNHGGELLFLHVRLARADGVEHAFLARTGTILSHDSWKFSNDFHPLSTGLHFADTYQKCTRKGKKAQMTWNPSD